MRVRVGRICILLMCFLLPACSGSQVEDSRPAQPLSDIERQLTLAYSSTDPLERIENVHSLTGQWLTYDDIANLTDEEASSFYTGIAFSSDNLIFPDPAIIRRSEDLAIVGLPNGLGLYLYDLSSDPFQQLEISAYTIGLNQLDIIRDEEEIGIAYETIGANNLTTVHFALIISGDDGWKLSWLSDEAPEWWFNASNGFMRVESDLSGITVTGQAANSTPMFDETADDAPLRTFEIFWKRQSVRGEDLHQYAVSPPATGYRSRQEWMWTVAQPSPYATLVQFIEQSQSGDIVRAAELTVTPQIAQTALDFGLHFVGRRYRVLESDSKSITFRDQQGAFVVTFTGEAPYLITTITPLGSGNEPLEPPIR